MVLPGSLLHCLRHESFAAEECYLGAVGSYQDQHVGIQAYTVSGWEVQAWLCVLARFFHSLKIATRRRLGLPHVGDLFLRYLSYKKGLCPGSIGQDTTDRQRPLRGIVGKKQGSWARCS
jgi:hypothetical protein